LKKDHVKIICGSDGLWDLLFLNLSEKLIETETETETETEDEKNIKLMGAKDLADFAETKWKQNWKYYKNGLNNSDNKVNKSPNYVATKFPDYDDIGVVTYEYFGPFI
jgi:hypothetical protein